MRKCCEVRCYFENKNAYWKEKKAFKVLDKVFLESWRSTVFLKTNIQKRLKVVCFVYHVIVLFQQSTKGSWICKGTVPGNYISPCWMPNVHRGLLVLTSLRKFHPLDETHLDAVSGLILPRGFHPAHQQVELVGAMWLRLTRTNRSAYTYAKDLIQSWRI